MASVIGGYGNEACTTDRPGRRLEGIKKQVDTICSDNRNVLERLHELEGRLVGANVNEPKVAGSTPHPVRPELDELSYLLGIAREQIAEMMGILGRLEQI